MTPRGIWKIHGAVQTQEAWKDWQKLASQALPVLGADVIAKYKPADDAGWRTIDKKIGQLRAVLQAYLSSLDS